MNRTPPFLPFCFALASQYGELPDLPPLAAATHAQLLRGLGLRLARVLVPSLRADFALFRLPQSGFPLEGTSSARPQDDLAYPRYLDHLADGGWQELLARQMLLDSLVNLTVKQWRQAAQELVDRFAVDAAELQKVFALEGCLSSGCITDIQSDTSDLHRDARSCATLSVGGKRMVYKPKSLNTDIVWHALCIWLQERGAPYVPVAPKTLDRGSYGWAEFIAGDESIQPTTAPGLYFNLGSMLAMLYALGAVDCHRENFIIHGTHPVLVDFETLMHPEFAGTLQPQEVRDSVLSTEILPAEFVGAGGQTIYFPGFDQTGSVQPLVESGVLLRDHAARLKEGFAAMYRFLLANRDKLLSALQDADHPLSAFKHCRVRFIYRSTMTYAITLANSLRRTNDESGRQKAFDRLRKYEPADAPAAILDALRKEEQSAMRRLNIPCYEADADDTRLSLGDGSYPVFRHSAFDRTLSRMRSMSLADMERQLRIIETATKSSTLSVANRADRQQNARLLIC